jgi:D-sedoheptulose 7-phosphate isomerase
MMGERSYAERYLAEAREILEGLDARVLEAMAGALAELRERGGRLFFLGVGGGAAHASHAVNDFRKLAGIESYTPADNVAELTARTNDEGWETTFEEYLRGSRLGHSDAVFVFSVGGGSLERGISANIVRAVSFAREVGAGVFGVVGRDGGYTARVADHCIVIPTVHGERVTPHTESFQAVVWHLLVTHPQLRRHEMKWESVSAPVAAELGRG